MLRIRLCHVQVTHIVGCFDQGATGREVPGTALSTLTRNAHVLGLPYEVWQVDDASLGFFIYRGEYSESDYGSYVHCHS